MPESLRVAFSSFSDITNPGSYTAPDISQLLESAVKPSGDPQFKFVEWWKIGEGETMREPFNICDEVVAGILHALEMVRALLHLQVLLLTRTAVGS